MTRFGDIKMFRPLPFLPRMLPVYDPGSYEVNAAESRAFEQFLIPGDILLRGYSFYLDGMVIPGFFSHAGLYLGQVTRADLNDKGKLDLEQADALKRHYPERKGLIGFHTGNFMVAHSMAEGVFLEDIIGFCRADYLAVLRFPDTIRAVSPEMRFDPAQLPPEEQQLQEALLANEGSGLDFSSKCLPIIRRLALSRLGSHYDFGFDFRNFNDMSCTEYVHFCTKSLQTVHGVQPQPRSLLGIRKYGITPDDFIQAKGALIHARMSSAVPKKTAQKLGWQGTASENNR